MPLLSVLIPNRNSPFTTPTINDVLKNSGVDTEVIVNVDESWPVPLVEDSRVTYLHPSSPIGLRAGINACARVAKGKYIMKCDDHCAFSENFGKVLIDSHQKNWVQIPRRYALDAENWKREDRTDDKYPIDYMYLDFPRKGKDHDDGTHGVEWRERREQRKDIEIDDTPSFQGSCYFMEKDYFDNFLGGMSEIGYGQFSQEAQEIGFKTWLGGGEVKVNKKCWYAHLHKGSRYGKMYSIPEWNQYTREASNWSAIHWVNNEEPNMVHSFSWLIDEKFPNMPSWEKNWQEILRQQGTLKA